MNKKYLNNRIIIKEMDSLFILDKIKIVLDYIMNLKKVARIK